MKKENCLFFFIILILLGIGTAVYSKIKFTATTTTTAPVTCTITNGIGYFDGTCKLSQCNAGYKPNGNVCDKIVPGSICEGADSKGVYTYDSNNNCNLTSCVSGYVIDNTGLCTQIGSDCSPVGADPNGSYTINASGDCILECNDNYSEYINSSGTRACKLKKVGSCVGLSDSNAVYMYDNEKCITESCNFGYVLNGKNCNPIPGTIFSTTKNAKGARGLNPQLGNGAFQNGGAELVRAQIGGAQWNY